MEFEAWSNVDGEVKMFSPDVGHEKNDETKNIFGTSFFSSTETFWGMFILRLPNVAIPI